jgi:hypothetical protein
MSLSGLVCEMAEFSCKAIEIYSYFLFPKSVGRLLNN